jgi:hypothetical protein
MADSSKFKGLVVEPGEGGRVYKLDGKTLDMTKDDDKVVQIIQRYKPTKGEYHLNEEDQTLIPAGKRAGTGDMGMYPDQRRARRHSSGANTFDEIGKKASEESNLVEDEPHAGEGDDKSFEKGMKEREENRKQEQEAAQKRREEARKEREKALKG